jgi:uncharacterized protein YqgV (UPF0045/DUF77 family)
MPRVIAQLSVHVLTPSPGCSQGHYISKCIALLQKHPVKYEIQALATTIEGKPFANNISIFNEQS